MPNIAQTPYAAPVSGHPPLSPACRCVIPILLVSQASMRSTPSAVTMARRRSRSSTASTPSRGSPRSLRREPGCAMQANIRWVLCCGSSLEQKAVCARCVSPVTLGALKVRFTVCVEPCTTKTKLHGRRGAGPGGGDRAPGGRPPCGRGVGRVPSAPLVAMGMAHAACWSPRSHARARTWHISYRESESGSRGVRGEIRENLSTRARHFETQDKTHGTCTCVARCCAVCVHVSAWVLHTRTA